jgi:hypothetical protein
MEEIKLEEIDRKIQLIKRTGQELKSMAKEFPALYRNIDRIMASIKMLEMNISDIIDVS